MGRVGAALEDKREYQQMLSEGRRRKVEGSSDQLRKVSPSDNAVSIGGYHITQQQLQLERAREVEQQLMTELQQVTREKERVTREKERVTREKDQVTREKEQVTREKERVTREKERVTREKEQVTREKERVTREKEQVTREKEQVRSLYNSLACVMKL